MGHSRSAGSWLILLLTGTGACTGLVAGPERSDVTPVAASRDSAYVRAKRALQGENFTLDVVDSSGGRLTGTRWPSSSAVQGSSAACHVSLALQVQGDQAHAEVASKSRWISPGAHRSRDRSADHSVAERLPPGGVYQRQLGLLDKQEQWVRRRGGRGISARGQK